VNCARCGHEESLHSYYGPGVAVCWEGGSEGCMCTGFVPKEITVPLTAQEIVDRAAAKSVWPLAGWRFYWLVWWCFPAAIILLFALYAPVHSWLHAHLQFLWGVLAGTLVQSVGWLRDRWRWLKWFSWQ